MDEIALINDARRGDLEAFNRLVLAYQDLAYNLACRMLGDPERAAECTQEAFFSAYRHLPGLRGGNFKAWVLRMVVNACLDELRRRKRRPYVPLEPEPEAGDALESPAWIASQDPSPEEQAVLREQERALARCLAGLEAGFRAVVLLVDLQEMDYEQAARTLHTPVGTVKSRLARARLKLRSCLSGFKELFGPGERQRTEGA